MPLPNLIHAVERRLSERQTRARADYERLLSRATAVADYIEDETAAGIVAAMDVLGLTVEDVRADLAVRKQTRAKRTANITGLRAMAPPGCSSVYAVEDADPLEDPRLIHFIRHDDQPEEHFVELVSIALQRHRREHGDQDEKTRLLAKEGIAKSWGSNAREWEAWSAQYIAKRNEIWRIRLAICAADETYRRGRCGMKRIDFILERLGRADLRHFEPVGLPPNGLRTL